MKLTSIARLAAVAALLMPLAATAQSMSDLQELSPEDRRAYFEAMSPEEREAKRTELKAERDAMSDEERQVLRVSSSFLTPFSHSEIFLTSRVAPSSRR